MYKKFRLKIPYLYREIVNVKENENKSLTHDVNDHVYSKLKSV